MRLNRERDRLALDDMAYHVFHRWANDWEEIMSEQELGFVDFPDYVRDQQDNDRMVMEQQIRDSLDRTACGTSDFSDAKLLSWACGITWGHLE